MATRLGAIAIMLSMVCALAGAAAAAQSTGRYVLKQTNDGFMRLDTETGSVAHCRQSNNKWHCDSLDDAGTGYRDEVARLQQQNRNLTDRIARLEAKLRGMDAAKTRPKSRVELPSDDELDEIMGFFEKLVTRFMQFARTLQDVPGEEI